MATCPCGSHRDLTRCCGPLLDGEPASTAEALMRSRYTAFARGDENHLFRTWHPRTRPPGPWTDTSTTWTGLQVLSTRAGGEGDETGEVEYVASWYRADGTTGEMHELARFERRARRWTYVDGHIF